ncbi:MAG TPA: M1 family metallopeptidase [Flavisolibacter sp.]|nr:M1 family metallopeptidase [Flavisolibacter sp.]
MRIFFLLFILSFFSVSHAQTNYDVLHYNFNLELSDKWDTINGKAVIRIKAIEPISGLDLDLSSERNGKGMRVQSITQASNNLNFISNNDKLSITFPAALKKGEERDLTIVYSGVPADGLIIAKNKYGDRTFFADNWPNRARFWIPCKDVPDDKASFEFTVTAPSQYKVISNGVKIEEKDLQNGNTVTHWKEDTPLPTKVMVIGAAKFAVKTFEDSPPNIPVSAWIYQQDSTKGFHDYAPATEILKFFSDYVAPFPYEKLANVQSKTIFGGMENASAIFYFENSVTGKGGIEDLLAHEIAHQWFGDMASEKSFAHLWLSEGFATYFTNIYWQYKFGKEAFQKRLQKERAEVIEFVKTNDRPVVDSLSPYMDLLNANSYQKGGWVLHMLRNEVGDSIFHKIIQTYYQQYKGSNADTRDLQRVAEKISGKNLKWFFDQWLYRPGIPQLLIDREIDKDEVKLRITQQGVKFDFPLEIGIVRTDGSSLKETIPVNSQMIEYKIKVPDVKSVIIDPDTKLLYSEIKK